MSVTAPQRLHRRRTDRRTQTLRHQRPLTWSSTPGRRTPVAAVYTSNRCKANPVLWSQKVSANGRARAVVLNSGGANCYTGDFGYETTELTASTTAQLLTEAGQTVITDDVLVCSTGLIGVGGQDFRDAIVDHLPDLVDNLGDSVDSGQNAAESIMTTDTVAKTATRQGSTGFTIGGMAKGAGMLAPGLATMLVVITTDAPLDQSVLDEALRASTAQSFDRLDTDGCMSTNDTVILMSSGRPRRRPSTPNEFTEPAAKRSASTSCTNSTSTPKAPTTTSPSPPAVPPAKPTPSTVSRSVARSALFKAAIFGEDPNWGRVVAQVGHHLGGFRSHRRST
jgi:glutamate N-acetyltransferase/amino-acid N-acetyltransferase